MMDDRGIKTLVVNIPKIDGARAYETVITVSCFAIAYVHKTFSDLGDAAWAEKPVQVLASKSILRSTSEKHYTPQANISRADFLCFLVRTLGIEGNFDGNFDDIYREAYYYKEIGIAKKLGITAGTGNNTFKPIESITRQDMMVLTERALRLLKKLNQQDNVKALEKLTCPFRAGLLL